MNPSREPYINRGTRQAIVFLFLLTLAIGGANLLFTATLVHGVNVNSAKARANKVSIVQLCQAGNEARQQQIDLWSFIIQITPPPPHETKAQARQREHVLHQFALHLHTIFAARDCTKGTP